jgi:AcrR family transcriptional regulator
VFAQVGFAGARIDEIARRAGVNKAMIYYHVGDKKALYEAALTLHFGGVFDGIKAAVDAAGAPPEKMAAYIRFLAGKIDENPQMVPIMLRQMAAGTENIAPVIPRVFAGVLEIVEEIIQDGVSRGVFRPATPLIIHLFVVGAIILLKASAPIRERFDEFPEPARRIGKEVSGTATDEVLRLILRALQNNDEENPDTSGHREIEPQVNA